MANDNFVANVVILTYHRYKYEVRTWRTMMRHIKADIAIAGGGVGGCAAALAAARLGKTVALVEETDWIGGQLTSQAVPPDEHRWIEAFGSTLLYRQFRQQVRAYYKQHFPLTPEARSQTYLNPGNGRVSRLCHDPRVALAVLQEMLAPYVVVGRVTLLLRHRLVQALVNGDSISSLQFLDTDSGDDVCVEAKYFLDATETGEVLPLAKVEYVTGAESQKETGEPHAVSGEAQPLSMQAITYCFAMDYVPTGDYTIARPENYEFWRQYQAPFWPAKQLSFTTCHPITLQPRHHVLFDDEPRGPGVTSHWSARRILDKNNFAPGFAESDITLVNWPQNDYWLGPIIEVDPAEAQSHLQAAKQLSLSLLYWLQTEAPRPDDGQGYPGLRLRPDVMGTHDGLAKYPYIRESRRIKAEFTVLEQHVATEVRGKAGAEKFPDTVGIGFYRIDLHPSTAQVNYIDIGCEPFQIPLGALIPQRMENLLPACKNLGVTHITNGCFRLHPVEWSIGEVAGYLAAWSIEQGQTPRYIRNSPNQLKTFQSLLVKQGIELDWPHVIG
jgi:hypothetical protein